MVEWMLAAAVVLGTIALMPLLLRRTRASRRNGGGSGVVIAIGMVFAMIFDPKAAQAMEVVEKKNYLGDSEADESGGLP